MKKLLLLLISILLFAPSWSQPYWQQTVNYMIEVQLDDQKHFLHARESVSYTNHSPDTLTFLWFHLWPNAYKNKNTAFARQQLQTGSTRFHFASEEQRGYIDSLNFSSGGETLDWEYHPEHIDIARIYLPEPLIPGDSVQIDTPFRVKIPDSFSRLGHVGQQYQITQWYPKPAVYDREGWHPMPYLDMGEFYSEFGTFEVRITLPESYIVGATGNLQTESEQKLLDSLAAEDWQESIYRYTETNKIKSDTTKTITYKQENTHDFAWFADKTYRVRKGEVTLPHSGRNVTLYALYNNTNYDVWQDILTYMEDATYYYSLWIGDYPYDVVTVVDGALSAGSGMEYPTITVLGASDPFALEQVTMHEIGHNWFYGVLASNERADAWMDEGINSYYEKRYLKTKYPDKPLLTILGDIEQAGSFFRWVIRTTGADEIPYQRFYELGYLLNSRRNLGQPPGLRADEFTSLNYGTMVYMKPAVIFSHLENYLGTEEFDRIMQLYYDRWKFRHPKPEDLAKLVSDESGKDMRWLFDDLIRTDKKLDYKINNIQKAADGWDVTLKNKSDIAAPMPVVATSDGDTVYNEFFEGFLGSKTIQVSGTGITRIEIDPLHYTLDHYRHDNQAYPGKWLPRSNPTKLQPLGGIEKGDKSELYFLPAAGINTRDKFMLGAALYNNLVPQQKFNFKILPMYSFGLNQLSGAAEINYHFYPQKTFRDIELTTLGRRYAGFTKLEASVNFIFQPASLLTGPEQSIRLGYNIIDADTSLLPLYETDYQVISASYQLSNGNALLQYGFQTELQHQPGEWTVWNNQVGLSHQYMQNKFLRLRLYYGNFLSAENLHPSYRLRLSGSTGYLMEGTFLDRAMISDRYTGFEHQTDLQQGGFRSFLPISSDQWLWALNVDFEIPFIGIFSLYGDAGGIPGDAYYSAGLQMRFFNRALRLFFPVVGNNYNGFAESFKRIGEEIRFTLELNRVNPLFLLSNTGR